jgi:hypothetical protein
MLATDHAVCQEESPRAVSPRAGNSLKMWSFKRRPEIVVEWPSMMEKKASLRYWNRSDFFALLAVGLIGAVSLPTTIRAFDAPPPKIGSASIWQVTPQFLTDAHSACDKIRGSNYSSCFIDQMEKAGAPAAAIAFTRELYKFNHGDVGMMGGFQPVGPVDIAWVNYPLRANTNYGLLLVNGEPRIIDVEDLKLLDQKTMEHSAQFQDLKGQFPNVNLWPGDRDGKTWPNSQTGPNGGIQFIADYPLRNGCHACARAGSAFFNWDFDAKGKFVGTTFVGMTPPPLP